VQFVDEEHGAGAVGGQSVGGCDEQFADVFDAGSGGIEAFEPAVGVFGDEFGECGFAGAWRAIEDHGPDAVGGEHALEQSSGSEDMFLAAEF